MIRAVMERYYPSWDPPEDDGRTWIPTECPVHGDENPSASVSYDVNAFNCHSCGYKGDYLAIIMREEEVSFGEAIRISEEIAASCGIEVSRSFKRKSSRGVSSLPRFGQL